MAHWFHRNPIKATEPLDFALKSMLTSPQTSKICSELRLRREGLLNHFKNASNDLEQVEDDFKQYMSLFAGFVIPVKSSGDVDDESISKLSPVLRYRWTNSMLGQTATEVNESWFEVLNMCTNMALWMSKHAAWVSAKDEVFEGDAKRAHTCLRRAAGILKFVKQNTDKVDGLSAIPGSDFDSTVLNAYIDQFTAEAQEITVARAIELKHSPGLVSALALRTSQIFSNAERGLGKLNSSFRQFEKWRCYLQLKAQIYVAYAYAFLGESLLAEDKCGDAVRTCREGMSCFNTAVDYVNKYAKASGPGFSAHPESHLFFRRIKPMLERHLEKAERENGFIYHQKVPDICPEPESKDVYGLVEAEQFTLPPLNKVWTPTVYAAFDLSKAKMPDFSKVKKSSKTLPAVQEERVYETDQDQSNRSGCVVS